MIELLREISEADMVAAFLRAEITSPRFSGKLAEAMEAAGAREVQIAQPDTTNDSDNEVRAQVLGYYRGYRHNRWLFGGFPDNLHWYKARLPREEIGDLRYVDYSYWNELTDNTHLVKDGVANIRKDKVVSDVSNHNYLTVADAIRHGRHDFEPIIVWGEAVSAPLEILEGHLRATAFGLAAEKAPTVIPVIVGLLRAADTVRASADTHE